MQRWALPALPQAVQGSAIMQQCSELLPGRAAAARPGPCSPCPSRASPPPQTGEATREGAGQGGAPR